MKQRIIRYIEGFADRVEDDTLPVSEELAIFLVGGLIARIFIWVKNLVGEELLTLLIFAGLSVALNAWILRREESDE